MVRTRRGTGDQNRPNYSGKHKVHGLLFLALADEKGNLIWISAAKPGRSGEITTVRHNKICAELREAGLGALVDLGFVGLDDGPDDPVIVTGRRATRGHPLTEAQKEANRLVNREPAANEHGFAGLENWRVLTKVCMNRPGTPPCFCRPCSCRRTPKSPVDGRSSATDHAVPEHLVQHRGELGSVALVRERIPANRADHLRPARDRVLQAGQECRAHRPAVHGDLAETQ
ncbi:transposase family protein [Kitasatospora sp. NPDC056731]|uniref:transposase family protein n=1 Tax=Kitasatospora sp. NPDC056731 TaxID=3155422 RepID=UPI003435C019